jgi:trk system potassium uptake protein TrkA
LSQKLTELGNDVMIVDESEEIINRMASNVALAKVADCKNEEVLKSLSVGSFDMCFVCIGSDFQSSLEITSLLKDLGAKTVISKASTKIQEKFLLRNGADAVVYPEKDLAYKLAVQYSGRNVYDYYKLSDSIAVYEVAVPKTWIGKTLPEIDVRRVHGVNVLAVRSGTELQIADPQHRFDAEDHVLVLGGDKEIRSLTK